MDLKKQYRKKLSKVFSLGEELSFYFDIEKTDFKRKTFIKAIDKTTNKIMNEMMDIINEYFNEKYDNDDLTKCFYYIKKIVEKLKENGKFINGEGVCNHYLGGFRGLGLARKRLNNDKFTALLFLSKSNDLSKLLQALRTTLLQFKTIKDKNKLNIGDIIYTPIHKLVNSGSSGGEFYKIIKINKQSLMVENLKTKSFHKFYTHLNEFYVCENYEDDIKDLDMFFIENN